MWVYAVSIPCYLTSFEPRTDVWPFAKADGNDIEPIMVNFI